WLVKLRGPRSSSDADKPNSGSEPPTAKRPSTMSSSWCVNAPQEWTLDERPCPRSQHRGGVQSIMTTAGVVLPLITGRHYRGGGREPALESVGLRRSSRFPSARTDFYIVSWPSWKRSSLGSPPRPRRDPRPPDRQDTAVKRQSSLRWARLDV